MLRSGPKEPGGSRSQFLFVPPWDTRPPTLLFCTLWTQDVSIKDKGGQRLRRERSLTTTPWGVSAVGPSCSWRRRRASWWVFARGPASEPMDERGATRVRRDLKEVSYVEPFRVRSLGAELLVSHFPGQVDRSSDIVTGSGSRPNPASAPGVAKTCLRHLALQHGSTPPRPCGSWGCWPWAWPTTS